MKTFTISIAFTCLSAILLTACSGNENTSTSSGGKVMTHADTVQRGAFLVETLGCNDCHSAKRMTASGPEIIPELMLSGYPADSKLPGQDKNALKKGWLLFAPDLTAAAGPWGVSFAGNLTPDPSGIGLWPYENFKRALTQGKFKGIEGSRTLLPPMPWQNYVNLPDEDVRAIFTYLKSIKPVQNLVPAALPPGQK
jgi:hypothetical protein